MRRLLTKESVYREMKAQARNNHGQEIPRDWKIMGVPLKEISKMSNQFFISTNSDHLTIWRWNGTNAFQGKCATRSYVQSHNFLLYLSEVSHNLLQATGIMTSVAQKPNEAVSQLHVARVDCIFKGVCAAVGILRLKFRRIEGRFKV